MQHANCFLRLSGDSGHNIAKYGITPAEAVVLRRIHGPDAISDLRLTGGNDKTPHADVLAALRVQYTARNKEAGITLVDELFPGYSPKLPTTFEEVGFQVHGSEPAPKAASRQDADTNSDGVLSAVELKAELDKRGIKYKGNASKAALAALLDKAIEDARMGGGSVDADADGDESADDEEA